MTAYPSWARDLLRCPADHSELTDADGVDGPELHCLVCRVAYRFEDGIPVLLIDEARPLP